MQEQAPSKRITRPIRKIAVWIGVAFLVPAGLFAWGTPKHPLMFLPALILGAFGLAVIRLGLRMSKAVEKAFEGYGIDKTYSTLKGFGTVLGRKAPTQSVAGVPGVGRVTWIRQEALRVNDDPIADVDLEVTVPNATPFRAAVHTQVPFAHRDLLRIGAEVPVIVGGDTPPTVTINWSRLDL
ncbi:MAG: hypothetical protein ACYDCC_03900 [Actinomycetota bacterium]